MIGPRGDYTFDFGSMAITITGEAVPEGAVAGDDTGTT
jgi:hypothetical protein